VREVAPLVVGLLTIGRGGLLLLGELAAMQRNGQYRALDAQGVDPFVALIMPRVLALAVSMFCLTIVFIVVAFLSGYTVASLLNLAAASPAELVGDMMRSIGGAGYFLIPAKTLSIGFAIGVVCCLTALERDDPEVDGGDPRPRGFMRAVLAVLLVSGVVSVL
jgi:phospholipid/cholesterol/gamma-HCH transport system permease protein